MKSLSRPVTAIGIAFVVIIWGLCWPVYKVALDYSPPLLYAGMRTFLGGLLLALALLPQWKKIQWKRNWYIYVIVAFFNTIIFNGVQTIGLQYLASGLFSVIVYLQPVLVVLIAWKWLKESLSAIKIMGLMIGFTGVVLVCLDGISGEISYVGIILALITATGWAFGVVYVKKTSTQVHGLWLVALQSIIGGLFLTGSGLAVENASYIEWNSTYLFCLIFGSIFSMALATAVYFKLMSSGEASKVGSFTFLVPLIAVGIGTIFLGEPFTISLLEGMVLILLSIYLINRKGASKVVKVKGKNVV
ncbi:DMT family transporter [Peribacillus sp. NPDC097264]|uniref:DMT family transporter n=1 Tax=Peribacillus sp. NPDC097264 TaxID=3390616 RepID=UPI003CFDDB5C